MDEPWHGGGWVKTAKHLDVEIRTMRTSTSLSTVRFPFANQGALFFLKMEN